MRRVRRIRKVLRFQAQAAATLIADFGFTANRSVELVASVQLQTGLVCEQAQLAARLRFEELSCEAQAVPSDVGGQYKIVVISLANS